MYFAITLSEYLAIQDFLTISKYFCFLPHLSTGYKQVSIIKGQHFFSIGPLKFEGTCNCNVTELPVTGGQ